MKFFLLGFVLLLSIVIVFYMTYNKKERFQTITRNFSKEVISPLYYKDRASGIYTEFIEKNRVELPSECGKTEYVVLKTIKNKESPVIQLSFSDSCIKTRVEENDSWSPWRDLKEDYMKLGDPLIVEPEKEIPEKFIIRGVNNLCLDDGAILSRDTKLRLHDCNTSNPNQQFSYNKETKLVESINKKGFCIDDDNSQTKGNKKLYLFNCDRNNINQQFDYDTKTGQFVSVNKKGLCMDSGGGKEKGSLFHLWECDSKNENQLFDLLPI